MRRNYKKYKKIVILSRKKKLKTLKLLNKNYQRSLLEYLKQKSIAYLNEII